MRTLVLPGYSKHNKKWAYDITEKVHLDQLIEVHEWRHWQEGTMDTEYEVEQVIEKVAGDSVNIIAKSIGTRVAMLVIPRAINSIRKLVLCGIPTKGTKEEIKNIYEKGLREMHSKDVLVIQNSEDPFAPYDTVKLLLEKIDPNIKIIRKEARNHEYPYFEEIEAFLKN